MTRSAESDNVVKCSFCGKPPADVGRLIAGSGVYICNECIGLCNEILSEEGVSTAPSDDRPPAPPTTTADEALSEVIEAHHRLEARLSRRPTVAELAAELGLEQHETTAVLRDPNA